LWKKEDYYTAGSSTAEFIHDVLYTDSDDSDHVVEFSKASLEVVDDILEGLFVKNGLKKPTTITKCFNEEVAM